MKKLLAITALTLSAIPAIAAPYGHYGHHGHWHRGPGGWVWVVPTIIGGVVGYEIARSQQPVVIQQPPVVIQQPPVVQQIPTCGAWVEIRNADGTITQTRTCSQ